MGAVPKYVAVTPDGRRVSVTNWCSADLSVIDTTSAKEVARIPLRGQHPRGIAVSPDSGTAYIALMGSDRLVRVDLGSGSVSDYARTGDGPRHLVVSRDGKHLFVTNNGDGTVSARPGQWPGGEVGADRQGARSLAISSDGGAVYSVNYESSTVTKAHLGPVDDRPGPHRAPPDRHHLRADPQGRLGRLLRRGILVFDDSRRPVA